jgi:hypothetical protein
LSLEDLRHKPLVWAVSLERQNVIFWDHETGRFEKIQDQAGVGGLHIFDMAERLSIVLVMFGRNPSFNSAE